ncbi:hypothetical protein BDV26DRAFT_257164 [Aspergillus bertholletiae]|uniref:Copper-fist domain-containing protein n=1 Tax=Aspergillus bertholletiae TaxID=1226010 RepID=A0A5N7BFG0_9EURO|nr:hypothetical protein BDV26DRAFT_257164 [Aspergillus bertholletiae]
MPLDEEGAKWSCEPCIRGHRSSKCQHFDRLMMKVPKAGRPLAKCPHPKGTCSCQKTYAFMIRIPKGSTCLCRPVYQVPVDQNDSAPPTPTALAPTASPAPGKIQKSSRRQIKTAPESIAKALDSIPDFQKQHHENGTPSHISPFIPQNAGLGTVGNSLPQGIGAPNTLLTHQALNGDDSKPPSGSCCSQKSQPPVQTKPQASCCKKPESPTQNGHSTEPTTNGLSTPYTPSLNATSFTPISTPQIPSWQDFNAAGQNNYYQPFVSRQQPTGQPTYVPDYTLHTSPKAVSMSFSHQNITSGGLTQSFVPQPLPHDTNNSGYAAPVTLNSDPTHNCSCGDNCQCLGCASHPFNNTTRQHVQEMGLLVAFDGEDRSMDKMNGYQSPSLHGRQHSVTQLDYSYTNFSHAFNSGAQHLMMHSYGEQSPTSRIVGNGYSSPPAEYLSEQSYMEPSEYYTLEYPVGLPSGCSDVTGNCQCGNDCSCVGCLTHSGHNGVSLEPTTTEASSLSPTAPVASLEKPGVGVPGIEALDDIAIPSMSPML